MANVPTPQEIRAIMEAREKGVFLQYAGPQEPEKPRTVPVPVAQLSKMRAEIQTLKGKSAACKSPAELRSWFNEMLQSYGLQPAEELTRMVMEKNECDNSFVMSQEQRIHVLETLMQYQMPKLKSVEITGTVDHSHTIVIVRYGEDGKAVREEVKNQRAPIDVPSVIVKGFESEVPRG